MLTDEQIIAQLRRKLRKYGLKVHKAKAADGLGDIWYQVLELAEDPKDHIDDEFGWFKLDRLIDYAAELEEKAAEYEYLKSEGKEAR